MSSHREAPEISKDPVADSTDVYAFVSPDKPDTVTIIANYIPFQKPDGGPNFYEFGDDVRYEIHISNSGDGEADVTYGSASPPGSATRRPSSTTPGRSTTSRTRPGTGRSSTRSPAIEERPHQGAGARTCPVRRSTSASAARRTTRSCRRRRSTTLGDRKVFAGQRADAFHVDLGSIFDLGALRPFNEAARDLPCRNMDGINAVQAYNVHTIAIQVPIRDLTRNPARRPTCSSPRLGDRCLVCRGTTGVAGVRRQPRARSSGTALTSRSPGSATRCSTRSSCRWRRRTCGTRARRTATSASPSTSNKPELAGLLPVLYPGVFPNLTAYKKPRADLSAILLTGIPEGVVPGFQNYTGPVKADMLRLNVAVPPAEQAEPARAGRRRPGRLPERSADRRRRRHDRAPGGRRSDDPAGRPVVHPRRRSQRGHGRYDRHQRGAARRPSPTSACPGGGYQTTPGTTKAS